MNAYSSAIRLAVGLALLSYLAGPVPAAQPAADLEAGFLRPPDSARPHTWWHWMNGNITKEGITADLEAMKKVGVGGAQIFNVSSGIEPGPILFMSPEWRALVKHAIVEADRLGIEICMHNCAGWSSSGGPWVKPDWAMQVLTIGETRTRGPRRFEGKLAQPPTKLDYYRDIAVVAFPTPPAEQLEMREAKPKITTATAKVQVERVADGRADTHVTFPLPARNATPYVQFEFAQPFEARSLLLAAPGGRRSAKGELQVSDDGKAFRKVVEFSLPETRSGLASSSTEFAAVRARFYRVVFTRASGQNIKNLPVAEIDLTAGLRIPNLGVKAAYVAGGTPTFSSGAAPAECVIPAASLVDLTAKMKPDGSLDWEVPAGEWTILRIGHTPTGKNNHPAPPSGEGLECDKLSRAAADRFFAAAVQPVIDDVGPLAGRSFKHVLIDSYEVGSQNWTDGFADAFKARCGYDLRAYLPALTGRIVGDRETTERFLWDYRRTVAGLFNDNYFGRFAELLHERGMLLSVEPYGNGPFDELTAGGKGDIPMGEFWVSGSVSGSPKIAASVAHTYGRRFVGAESFTAKPEVGRWLNHPASIKSIGDQAWCVGINRYIFHRYAHQPWMDRLPGMTMGQWGFHFERTVTWWEQSAAWLKYVARSQWLLQEGAFEADVLCYAGVDSSSKMPGRPAMAAGYDYDGCDFKVLKERVTVKDGRLAIPDGATYRVLVLPDRATMTPEEAVRIRDLVREGALVVGPRPAASPSLAGGAASDEQVRAIAAEVWGAGDLPKSGEHAFGKGRVTWGRPLDEVLAAAGAPQDVEFRGNAFSRLTWIHRRAGAAEVYFVANNRDVAESVECTFRVAGLVPELWHSDTGRIETPAVWSERDGRTVVPMYFEPAGSVFVVFRKPAAGAVRFASVRRADGASATPVPVRPALVIRKAIYGELGVPEHTRDVTERLLGMIQGGMLTAKADNKLAGGDPASLIHKQMQVDYTLGGEEKSVIVEENAVLTLGQDAGAASREVELTVADGVVAARAYAAGRYVLTPAAGAPVTFEVPAVPPAVEVAGPWTLAFAKGWGAPERMTVEKLASWTTFADPGAKYFSGTATYRASFERGTTPGPDEAVELDLGRVEVIAEVRLNGQDLGVLWKPPFRVDVTGALKKGANELEVKVTNLWPNRLIGDAGLPENQRKTFTTWKHWTKDDPLLPSGLLGPVRLVPVALKQVR